MGGDTRSLPFTGQAEYSCTGAHVGASLKQCLMQCWPAMYIVAHARLLQLAGRMDGNHGSGSNIGSVACSAHLDGGHLQRLGLGAAAHAPLLSFEEWVRSALAFSFLPALIPAHVWAHRMRASAS